MDLQSLKAVLKPLQQFGQDELTFEVEGLPVTLRPLLPEEEIKCQQYAAQILKESAEEDGTGDDDPLTRAAQLRYFDKFRAEVLSYALVQVGQQDLRRVRTIETDEFLEDGVTRVRVPIQRALRDLINSSWSRGMITIGFARYGDMITKIAEKADRVARDSISDLDAEIDRVALRLENLKAEREKRAAGDPSVTAQQIQALVQAGEALEQEIDDAIQTSRADRELAEELANMDEEPAPSPPMSPAPAPRRPVVPQQSPPPTAPPPAPKPPAQPEVVSSFGDMDEPGMQALENQRIFAAQRAAEAQRRAELEQGSLRRAEPAGTVRTGDGQQIDAYRLPAQTLSERGRKEDRSKAQVNPNPAAGTRNPKFNPPQR